MLHTRIGSVFLDFVIVNSFYSGFLRSADCFCAANFAFVPSGWNTKC